MIRFLRPAIILFALVPAPQLGAQSLQNDYFPGIFLGFSAGYFNPALEHFEEDNTQEPLLGLNAGLELINFGGSALYGVVRYNYFVGRERGRELIKWQAGHYNIGLRWSKALSFLARPNAQLWLSTGFAKLKLSRKDFNTRQVLIFENGRPRKISIDESTTERWDTGNFFIEIGQMVPFELNHTPNMAIFWAVKYDSGRSGSMNLGGFSFMIGFNFIAVYSSQ